MPLNQIIKINQTSSVLRYVFIEGSSMNVEESFVDFMKSKGKTQEYISNLILEKVNELGIDIAYWGGLTYNNAALISGKYNGIQKRINNINPKAKFVSCLNNSLYLASVHVSPVTTNSITSFGDVKRLFTLFSSSTYLRGCRNKSSFIDGVSN